MRCNHCGYDNDSDAIMCVCCGKRIDKNARTPLNKLTLTLAIISSAITIIAFSKLLALLGLTVAAISLVIIAIMLLRNKPKGKLSWNIALSIYGFLANLIWLVYILEILPNL